MNRWKPFTDSTISTPNSWGSCAAGGQTIDEVAALVDAVDAVKLGEAYLKAARGQIVVRHGPKAKLINKGDLLTVSGRRMRITDVRPGADPATVVFDVEQIDEGPEC